MKNSHSILTSILLSLFFFFQTNAFLTIETSTPAWTASKEIAEDLPKPLFQTDAESGLITINEPGHYLIRENIEGGILTATNNVILDLDGHEIYVPASIAIDNIIEIQKGSEKIKIHNGTIRHNTFTNSVGVYIGADSVATSSHVLLQDLKIMHAETGIYFDGNNGSEIVENCSVINCTCTDCYWGFLAEYANHSLISGLRIVDSTASRSLYGMSLDTCKWNVITDCYVAGLNSTSNDNAFAWELLWGEGNILKNCIAESIICNTGSAYGVYINEETDLKILNCIVNYVEATTGANGRGFRFTGACDGCFIDSNKLLNCSGYGIQAAANLFDTTIDNVAIQNIALNCLVANYTFVANTETYDQSSTITLVNEYNNLDII